MTFLEKLSGFIFILAFIIVMMLIWDPPERPEKKNIILLDGTKISCYRVDTFPCGYTLSDCSDKQEHFCTNNFTVEK
jgi:hypothetical protein